MSLLLQVYLVLASTIPSMLSCLSPNHSAVQYPHLSQMSRGSESDVAEKAPVAAAALVDSPCQPRASLKMSVPPADDSQPSMELARGALQSLQLNGVSPTPKAKLPRTHVPPVCETNGQGGLVETEEEDPTTPRPGAAPSFPPQAEDENPGTPTPPLSSSDVSVGQMSGKQSPISDVSSTTAEPYHGVQSRPIPIPSAQHLYHEGYPTPPMVNGASPQMQTVLMMSPSQMVYPTPQSPPVGSPPMVLAFGLTVDTAAFQR